MGPEAVPPEPPGLVADIDPALEQQIFDLPQGERIVDLKHHREADHHGGAVEVAERISHCRRQGVTFARLKPIWSDNALRYVLLPMSPSRTMRDLAEGEGFEPSVRASVQRFSRPPRSTTPAPLRISGSGPTADAAAWTAAGD